MGTVTHELSHAVALRAFGVPVEISWLPGRERTGLLRAALAGGWAAVSPRAVPRDLQPWRLRVAAMMPLLLAAPLALVGLGVLTDPFAGDTLYRAAAAVGWLACALPSPQDFSVLWYAEAAIEEHRLADTA